MSFFARSNYTATSGQTDFTIGFPYIDSAHVEVYLNDSELTSGTDFTLVNGGLTVRLTNSASEDDEVLVKRNTPRDARPVDYVSAFTLSESDLDLDSTHTLYVQQELTDDATQQAIDEAASMQALKDELQQEILDARTYAEQLATGNAEATQTVNDLITSLITPVENQVDDLADDTVVTVPEKLQAKRAWERAQQGYADVISTATDFGVEANAQITDMTATYTALNTYLNTTLEVFDDMSSSTTGVNRTTWDNTWNAFEIDFKQAELYLGVTAKNLADLAQASADSVETAITALGLDSVITPAEKKPLKLEWEIIQSRKSKLDAQTTALGLTAEFATYETEFNDLGTYLNTTIDVFDDMTSNTSVTRATWDGYWKDYYDAERDLEKEIEELAQDTADLAEADAASALATLAGISADNKVTASEAVLAEGFWDDVVNEAPVRTAQASLQGVSATAYSAAYDQLDTYLNTTLEVFTHDFSADGDIDIDRTTWNSKWRGYYSARATLDDNILSRLGTSADVADSYGTTDTISKGAEKLAETQRWAIAQMEYAKISALAGSAGVATATTDAYTSAYDALDTYISGLTSFTTTSVDTSIDETLYTTKWEAYEEKRRDTLDAISEIPVSVTADIVDDGVIDPNEYQIVNGAVIEIRQQTIALTTQAATFSGNSTVSSALSTYNSAYTALEDMLTDIAWDSSEGTSIELGPAPLTRSQWRTIWNNYWTAEGDLKAALLTAQGGDLDSVLVSISDLQTAKADQSSLDSTNSTLSTHTGLTGENVHGLGSASVLAETATVGDPGIDTALPTEKAVRTAVNAHGVLTGTSVHGLGSASVLDETTSVGDPGVDTALPTEKAVRNAIGGLEASVASTYFDSRSGTATGPLTRSSDLIASGTPSTLSYLAETSLFDSNALSVVSLWLRNTSQANSSETLVFLKAPGSTTFIGPLTYQGAGSSQELDCEIVDTDSGGDHELSVQYSGNASNITIDSYITGVSYFIQT